MKKVALSLAVIAASGAYVWSQWNTPQAPLLPLAATSGSKIGDALPLLPDTGDGTTTPKPQTAHFVVTDTPLRAPAEPDTTTVSESLPAEPPPLPAPVDETPVALPTLPAEPVAPATSDIAPIRQAVINVPLPRLRPEMLRPPVTTIAATPAAMRMASATATFADGTYDGPVVDAYYGLMQIGAVIQGGRLHAIRVLRYPNDRRTSIYINQQALPMLRDEVISAQSANVDIISGATLSSEAFLRSLNAALAKARA